MHLVRKEGADDESKLTLFRGLTEALTRLFVKEQDPAVRLTGWALLIDRINPFGLVPSAKQGFFDGLKRFSGYMDAAYRGGLFRRDE